MENSALEREESPAPHAEAFKHILHPTDFSPEAFPAFAHAVRLAAAARSHLTIVHAAPDGSEAGYEWEQFPKVRALLAKWGMLPDWASQEAVFETLGVQVNKADLARAHPAHGITKYVERHPCDLIVLGTHARDGLDLWFKGSVAASLAREAHVPTLFVPNASRGVVNSQTGKTWMRNVLIPVDAHPGPARAASLAYSLARTLGHGDAHFHLLHVGGSMPAMPSVGSPNVDQIITPGPVVEGLLDAAKNMDVDLIVMATEGRHGFLDALRGSTTEQIIRKAARLVLAVPQT